jgi:cytoskeleton protein RodZ
MAVDDTKNELLTESDRTSDAPDLPNERLRAAREQSGMNIDDVAHALHLERDVILALESADYDLLGAPVFVRGYLRSYARLLDLPEDEIVSAIKTPDIESEEFKTLSMTTEVRPGANLASFVLWLVVGFVVLAGIVYLLSEDEREGQVSDIDKGEFVAPEPPVEMPAEPEEPEAEDPAPVPAAELQVGDAAPEIAEETDDGSVPEPPAPVAPVYKLSFEFDDECWVEISDADNRLLYGLEKRGSVRMVEGRPPFRLFLGNAAAVNIEIDGEAFAIPGSRRPGNKTVRFSISADQLPEKAGDE